MITVASPTQVAGPRSRLSLDLSALPPSFPSSSPGSPGSVVSLEPASPTFSGSWTVNKSNADLTALLKEAYNKNREKERDLTLAAEIGKSLLENNNVLKAKYEALAAEYRKLQRRQTSGQSYRVQGKDKNDVTRIAPPSSALLDTFTEEPSDYSDSDSDSVTGVSSGLSIADAYLIKRSRSPRRNNNINFKELEQIRELECLNQDLQARLDNMMAEMNENEKANRAKNRKLQAELDRLHDAAGLAAQKIEELEKENSRLTEKQKSDFWKQRLANKKAENEDIVEELLRKVQELEEQNVSVERAKAEIDRRLQLTTKELAVLQEKSAVLEDTQKECENLHDVLRNQSEQIRELNQSLEAERQLNLGMRSNFHSRSNSFSNGTSGALVRRTSQPDGMRAVLLGGTPATSPNGLKCSLLEEMESAWYRQLAMFQRDRKHGPNDDDAASVASSEYDLQDFLKRNGVHPDEDEISCIEYYSDEEFTFLEEFEEDEVTALRRREWFWRRWIRAILRFFLAIWRWCRFLVLIAAAVLMALYRGPDAVLPPIEM